MNIRIGSSVQIESLMEILEANDLLNKSVKVVFNKAYSGGRLDSQLVGLAIDVESPDTKKEKKSKYEIINEGETL